MEKKIYKNKINENKSYINKNENKSHYDKNNVDRKNFKTVHKSSKTNDTKSHLDNKLINTKSQKENKTKNKSNNSKNVINNSNITQSFKVNYSNTLMEFLLEKCNTSRNNVKSLLSNHKVLVNGSMVSQYNFELVKDDVVALSRRPVGENDAIDEKYVTRFNTVKLPFKIIYSDDYFIAVDKPAGLLSVESDTERESVYTYLLRYFAQKDKTKRPYQLHRIDKETSGVLVFAKNPVIHSMLKMKWNDYVRAREYYAVVEGVITQKEGTYVSYLAENSNHLVYSSLDKNGKRAVTHYETIKINKDFSLLKVNIDTGRKNQIRVHMHDIKHPIVGDEKYGCTLDPLGRLGLHASKLEFVNPITHQTICIEADVPKEFFKVVE